MKLLALLAKRRPRRIDLGRNDEGLGGPAQFLARRRDLFGAERRAVRRRRALLVRRAETDDRAARDQRRARIGERGVERATNVGGIVPVAAFDMPAGRGVARRNVLSSTGRSSRRW